MEDVCIYAALANKREYQYLEVGSSVSQTITLQPEPRIVRPTDGIAHLSTELSSLVNARVKDIRKQLHSDKYPKLPPDKKLALDRIVARLAECARTILDDSLRREWHSQHPVGDKRHLCGHSTPSGPCNKTKTPNQPWCDTHVPHHCSHPTPSGPCNKTKAPNQPWCVAHTAEYERAHCSHPTPWGACGLPKLPHLPFCEAHSKGPKNICGATTFVGGACQNPPTPGYKRCHLHIQSFENICGAWTEAGGACQKAPTPGYKRCHLHRGRHRA
jgi:hypothetical protein